jgi:hypothetical protein
MVKVRKPRGGYCKKYSAGLVGKDKPYKKKKANERFIVLQYTIQIDNPDKLINLEKLPYKVKRNHLRININVTSNEKEKALVEVKQMLIDLEAKSFFISIIE